MGNNQILVWNLFQTSRICLSRTVFQHFHRYKVGGGRGSQIPPKTQADAWQGSLQGRMNATGPERKRQEKHTADEIEIKNSYDGFRFAFM
jgi:hypothetical protein